MRFFLLILCLFSSHIFADYNPPMVFAQTKTAEYVGYVKPNYIYKCKDSEKLVNQKNASGNVTDASCAYCPTGYSEWDNVIVNDTPDPDRWVCQKPCKDGEKRLPRFQGAGYSCYTCNEIWKEWEGTSCVEKKCPPPLVLDISTGSCKEYDVKCPFSQEKVFSYTTTKPYCTSYCSSYQYRSTTGRCETIPKCQPNQKLTSIDYPIKTTIYKEYKCETTCLPDENEIGGQCFKRCEENEIFEDGQCVSQDGIIAAINRLKNNLINKNDHLIDDLYDFTDPAIEDLYNANEALDNIKPNQPSEPDNDYDTSLLDAETPFINIETIFDQNIFTSKKQCPDDRSFAIWSATFDFKYSRICGALQLLSNLVMSIAIILSYFIIRRG